MRRVLGIVSVYSAALALAAWAAIRAWGVDADRAGRDVYPYRAIVAKQLAAWRPPVRPSERTVVWLGDSTVLGLRGISYPQVLEPTLRAAGIRTRIVGWLGMDFYGYYFLTTTIVRELRPDVLVVVAHLRLFAPLRSPRSRADDRPGMNDLASYLGPAELPAALGLPLAAHDLTVPRLLLTQSLRLSPVEQAHRWFEGGRRLATDATVLDGLGPRELNRGHLAGLTFMRMILEDSDVEVTPDHPIVETMAATVRYAAERGVCVLVVGTPLPYEAMARRRDGYNADVYARRFGVLRVAVEASGGAFLDAHEALRSEEFVDVGGHFSPAGAEHMARLVGDGVRETALHGCAATTARMEAHASP
jgi:hypothetical protein